MRTPRRTLSLALLLPVLALGACGGGDGDADQIKGVIADVAEDAATICDNASDKFLGQIGGDAEACKKSAAENPDDSDKTIEPDKITVKVDGETATADFTDNDGEKQHVTFVKAGGDWVVDEIE
jgi:hypothetical protein